MRLAEPTPAIHAAAAVLGDRAERDVSLAPFTTYRLGGPAALFVRARSVDDLAAVAAARAASGLPVLVVGRGSNLLVADAGFPGIAVLATALGGDLVLPDAARSKRARPAVGRVWRCRSSPGASPRPDGAVSSGPSVFPARSAAPCG